MESRPWHELSCFSLWDMNRAFRVRIVGVEKINPNTTSFQKVLAMISFALAPPRVVQADDQSLTTLVFFLSFVFFLRSSRFWAGIGQDRHHRSQFGPVRHRWLLPRRRAHQSARQNQRATYVLSLSLSTHTHHTNNNTEPQQLFAAVSPKHSTHSHFLLQSARATRGGSSGSTSRSPRATSRTPPGCASLSGPRAPLRLR
jgi:hypothetical protein